MPRGFSKYRRCVAPGSSNGSAFGSQASSNSRRSRKIGSVLSPRTRRAGWVTRLPSSYVNAHCCTAGSSWPKNVSALATAWSKACGSAVQLGTVVRPADSPQPGIDGPGLIARPVALESGPDGAADEFSLPLILQRRPRRVQETGHGEVGLVSQSARAFGHTKAVMLTSRLEQATY